MYHDILSIQYFKCNIYLNYIIHYLVFEIGSNLPSLRSDSEEFEMILRSLYI